MRVCKSGKLNISFEQQTGFTLIELMIVTTMLAILSVIALPSYRQYVTKNTESQVTSDMLRLSGQLDQWRAKTLNYSNFVPREGYTDNDGEGNSADNIISSPIGNENPHYNIQIQTINNDRASNITAVKTANNWVMVATPIDEKAGLNNYALTSTGIRCFNNIDILAKDVFTNSNCGTGGEQW